MSSAVASGVGATTPAVGGPSSPIDSVRVCARFRPLSRSEENSKLCVTIRDDESLELLNAESSDSYPFTFSKVFDPATAQEAVYRDVGAPIIRDVFQGYNGTIFVYGQTGSGKTYTMMGAELHSTAGGGGGSASPSQTFNTANNSGLFTARSMANSNNNNFANAVPQFHFDGPLAGIVPRAVFDLFDRIQNADADLEFEIKLFFVEIYMEHVRDLLEPSRTNLNVREEPATNSFYVDGCECPYVSSAEEVIMYVEQGLRNRTTAATKMNDVSSRSHCLLGLTVKSNHTHKGETKVGKLFLVDLAGTEKVAKTKAEGVQLEEAKLINKSLTTLGLVIKNLTESRAQHIPYRDSKLTKILQDALGGNSRTSLIVCCSPSMFNCQETHSTLRFGARAKHIKNRAVVNKEYTVTELKHLLLVAQQEIHRLKSGLPMSAIIPTAVSSSTTATMEQQEELHALQMAAKIQDVVAEFQAQLASKDELLREAQEGRVIALHSVSQQDLLLQSLQEEVQTWELEYNTAVNELAVQSRRLDRERAARTADRSLLDKLLEASQRTRNDVQLIRSTCLDAMRDLQLGGVAATMVGGGAPTTPTPDASKSFSSSQQQSESGAAAAEGGTSQGTTTATPGLSAVDALTARNQLLEKQYADLEESWKDLMNENGTLMLELQLADKKLAIRHDRIENLKSGLKQERLVNKDLQDELEEERKGWKEKLIEARSDAEYWRHRFEAMQHAFFQPRSGGGSASASIAAAGAGALTSAPSGMFSAAAAAASSTNQLSFTPQHSRVIKHIRGGIRGSPPGSLGGSGASLARLSQELLPTENTTASQEK